MKTKTAYPKKRHYLLLVIHEAHDSGKHNVKLHNFRAEDDARAEVVAWNYLAQQGIESDQIVTFAAQSFDSEARMLHQLKETYDAFIAAGSTPGVISIMPEPEEKPYCMAN